MLVEICLSLSVVLVKMFVLVSSCVGRVNDVVSGWFFSEYSSLR